MIARLNFLLFGILIACALGLVTAQHKARKFYVDLQNEQELGKRLEVEWGQLQLEQHTWAMHGRVEQIAAEKLNMRVPPPARIQVVPAHSGGAKP